MCAFLLVALLWQPFEAVEPHMGTLVRIKLYAADEAQAKAAFRAAFERIEGLDQALSDYRPDSELNRLCREGVGHPVHVSKDLFRVLAASARLANETGGAFDVTLGPVVRLWRDARKQNRAPDLAAIQAARARCGYRKLHLDPEHQSVMLDQAGMQLDLGGIAKGYAADEALAVLEARGIRCALVAASGDLAFGDPPPGQPGWKIGIDSLDRPAADFTSVLELRNAAVSTSGDAEQHLDTGGRRYSHIIDPSNGQGLTGRTTVTIVAPRGIDADSLATAVSVLGVKRGMALVESRPHIAALIVARDRTIASKRFRRLAGK